MTISFLMLLLRFNIVYVAQSSCFPAFLQGLVKDIPSPHKPSLLSQKNPLNLKRPLKIIWSNSSAGAACPGPSPVRF